MTCYGKDKREESGKNPSSAICAANTGKRAMYGKKRDTKNTIFVGVAAIVIVNTTVVVDAEVS